MAVDDLVEETYTYYEDNSYFPDNTQQFDQLVRMAVTRLADNPEQSRKILRDVQPSDSVRYLALQYAVRVRRLRQFRGRRTWVQIHSLL